MLTCTWPSSGGSRRIVSRCVPSDVWPSDTRTGAICAAGEAGLDAGDGSSGAATAAGDSALDGVAVAAASIAIGGEGCADVAIVAPSAMSWPAGVAVIGLSEAVGGDPTCVGAVVLSGPWLAGALEVGRAAGNSAARVSAIGSAGCGARKSTMSFVAAAGAVRVAPDALASGSDGPVCGTDGLLAAASDLDNLWYPRLSQAVVRHGTWRGLGDARCDDRDPSGRYCRWLPRTRQRRRERLRDA